MEPRASSSVYLLKYPLPAPHLFPDDSLFFFIIINNFLLFKLEKVELELERAKEKKNAKTAFEVTKVYDL